MSYFYPLHHISGLFHFPEISFLKFSFKLSNAT